MHESLTKMFHTLIVTISLVIMIFLTVLFFVLGKIYKWPFMMDNPALIAVTLTETLALPNFIAPMLFYLGEVIKTMSSP